MSKLLSDIMVMDVVKVSFFSVIYNKVREDNEKYIPLVSVCI